MKFCRIAHEGQERYCIVEDNAVRLLNGTPFAKYSLTDTVLPVKAIRFLSPASPSKVVAIGKNYADHALEMGEDAPELPLLFLKPSTSVVAHEDAIVYPKQSERVDYEAELAVVMKKRCKNVSKEAAMDYVLGFTCLNDVTARDLQSLDKQWTRAKGFDTFCPIGPWIETDFDWRDANIQLLLNGEIKQSSTTARMIHKCDALISFISEVMTLEPGDVIATGTPSGIGPMDKGDTVEVSIEGLGILRNTVR